MFGKAWRLIQDPEYREEIDSLRIRIAKDYKGTINFILKNGVQVNKELKRSILQSAKTLRENDLKEIRERY